MTDTKSLRIETADRAGLDRMIDWAAAEGWNPGLDDATPFLAADTGAFLMGWLDDRPVTCISVTRYGTGFGFLGFYICDPAFRGQGYGLQTWQAGVARLDGRVVGLDGVVAQQHNYRKSGFVYAHANVRVAGTLTVPPPVDGRLRPIDASLIEAIVDYDRPFFADDRVSFLRCWLGAGHRRGIALIDDGKVTGYGVIRPCREGHKIAPLFADDAAGADLLFRALAATVPGETVILDPPDANPASVALGARYGLKPIFETARMYRGPAPALPLDRIYGITSLELG